MKNIRFSQPKYVVPLIILPFIFLFYFIFRNWNGSADAGQASTDTLPTNQINPLMPGVAREITDEPVKDKFGAYQEAFKNNTDFSMIGNIDAENGSQVGGLSSAYSLGDIEQLQAQKTLDSLQRELQRGQQDIDRQMQSVMQPRRQSGSGNASGRPRYGRSTEETFLAELERMNTQGYPSTPPVQNRPSQRDSYTEQMDLFREQMRLVDSIQQAGQRPTQSATGVMKKNRQAGSTAGFDPSADSGFRPLPVSLQPEGMPEEASKGFHTLRTVSPAPLVSAMIDQELKVNAGNRVRIRLLQDIYVGGNRVPKGTYLFAQVTGFQTSRINLSITSIFLNGRTLPVELDIYDNDGYLGLYVPGSNFREFTKEIGTQATRGLSQVRTADQSDIAASLLSQLFETATSATTKMIKKEKAVLTYNYSIYLKEKQ